MAHKSPGSSGSRGWLPARASSGTGSWSTGPCSTEWYREQFDSDIDDDYVLGPDLQTLLSTSDQGERAEALQGLLNGETGRLDCGTLWSWLEEFKE